MVTSNGKELTKQNTVFVDDGDGNNYAIHEDDVEKFYSLLEEADNNDDYTIFDNCNFLAIGGDHNLWRKKNLK